ncbi:hypothetical protein ACFC0R_41275, partial [Streptomyces sp. NPDC056086]|uniref:hypothetical protein n=1 Tax=Streptomyces sp. NPDC056086 TaxID=3345709 RepID=UPI0035DB8733
MTGRDPAAVLSCDFLLTAMAGSGPDDPVVQLAAQQVRSARSVYERLALAEALLSGPYAQQAPKWLLEAAVTADVEAEKESYRFEGGMTLAARALEHPSWAATRRGTTRQTSTRGTVGPHGGGGGGGPGARPRRPAVGPRPGPPLPGGRSAS